MKLPKRLERRGRAYLPKARHVAILVDVVQARDLNHKELRFFCDDCAHYSSSARKCTIGYPARHTKAEQLAHHALTGRMALCRAIEID